MMIWELISMSDKITLMSDDFRAVAIVTLLLGQGQYGAEECGVTPPNKYAREVPMFAYFKADGIDRWFKDMFPEIEAVPGEYLTGLINAVPKRDLARVLRTVQVCGPEERKSYQKALEAITDPVKKREYIDWWKEERRTSLNDIAARAWHLADKLDEQGMKEERESGGK